MFAYNLDEKNREQVTTNNGIISILGNIQSKYGYLPKNNLIKIAEKTGHSLVDLYGVATFYKHFSLTPRGKHIISVCLGTACHVRGGAIIAEEFERKLEIKVGETTPDKEFTLETVACLGACALGPIVAVDGHYFSNVSPNKVKQILKKVRSGPDKVEVNKNKTIFPINVNCSKCNHSLMDQNHLIDDHASIKVINSFNGKYGWLRLSSLYGSYNIEAECKQLENEVAKFFCPYCNGKLIAASNCIECNAPMVPMIVKEGGILQFCSRYGCKESLLELNGIRN